MDATKLGLSLFVIQACVGPILFSIAAARLTRIPQRDVPVFIGYTLGFWSAVCALILDLLFRFAGEMSVRVYVTAIEVLALTAVLLAIFPFSVATRALTGIMCRLRDFVRHLDWVERVGIVGVSALSGILLVQNLAHPLTENDPIVHTVVAQHLMRDLSIARYPFAEADPLTGFFLEGNHPLGFALSKTLLMLLIGDPDTPWHKPQTATYFIYLLIAIGVFSARAFGFRQAALAIMLAAACPLLVNSVLAAHIDPLRVYFFFVPFALLAEHISSRHRGWLIGAAIAFALALHVHAGNVLLIGFLGPIYLLMVRDSWTKRIAQVAAILGFAILVSGAQYWTSYQLYGSPLTGEYSIDQLSSVPIEKAVALQRNLVSLHDILVHGVFAPFTDLQWFTHVFWLALIGIVFVLWEKSFGRPHVKIVLAAFAIYALLQAVAVAGHVTTFYKNTRYTLIILPFAAVLGAQAIFEVGWRLGFHAERGGTRRSKWPNLVTLVLLLPVAVSLSHYFHLRKEHFFTEFFFAPDQIFRTDLDKVSIAIKRRTAPVTVRAAYASRTVVPEGAVILTFRDAEIYLYGNHRTLSHFDPQVWEIYNPKDVSAVEAILKAKGIRYFYMPSHNNVTLSGNALHQLLGDPSKVRILYQDWASLLEYVPEGLPVERHAILRWEPDAPLPLSRGHWTFIPPQIGECESLRNVIQTPFETYFARWRAGAIAKSCVGLYNDVNWIVPSGKGNLFQLRVGLDRPGCILVRYYFRIATEQGMTLTQLDREYIAVEPSASIVFNAIPPHNSNAVGLAFWQNCGIGATIRSVELDAVSQR